jgi:hypothetical protein
MRSAIVALIASCAGCFGSSDPTPVQLPVAPVSAITVTTAATTFQGSVAASIIRGVTRCPADAGVGVLAETADAAVTAVFPRWPAEGSIFDLALPGAEDDVIVNAHVNAGDHDYCTNTAAPASGTVEVRRFEQVGSRYLVDVVLTGVVAGATTVDAHLYH